MLSLSSGKLIPTAAKFCNPRAFQLLGSPLLLSSVSVPVLVRGTVYCQPKVESAVQDYGLATLVVDCDEFWEHTHPLELHDDLPSIGETVSVLAYGLDHNTIELVDGAITSSDPPRDYQYGTLSIQVNKDSCSPRGPIFLGNKIVGLYQGFGYETIPASVIKSFLDGLEERQTSFGSIDIWYQTMEDAQLRKHFKMSHDMTGVLIINFVPLSNAIKVLKLHDVILGIEGFPDDNDGTIRHLQKKELFSFDHLISMKKPGKTALVRILRDGKEHVFSVSLNFTQPLVPYKFLPSYYIVAGFVFVSLSKPYVDKSSAICKCALNREAKADGEQIVIISQVKKVYGVEVVNLKHLSELVENCALKI
ncbi:unnamed protein product [Eruca vesicaria subsp. sativa]|uniref:Protease Do-like PDZ domain-containing protein n=1 Tax=Eruca vesicaria subsp. sativa TaxID=29727 RepID=A0ABC8LPX4_ERUVS|nr:unnamed protein product [Eruca vesicaria subsp. sativa]